MSQDTHILDLWIRAGLDGMRSGGCRLGQQLFMILLLKAENASSTTLQFNVKTVNLHKPNEEFRALGIRHLPALVHGEVHVEHFDEILEYLESKFPHPSLNYDNPEADLAVKDVFSKFCYFVKDISKDPRSLEHELRKVDSFLGKNGTTYLCGDRMCHLDCDMLPKLHHIRLACKHLKNYCAPGCKALPHLWVYLQNAYASTVFKKSCPCDQEIILHWADRPDTINLTALQHKTLSKEEPKFSFDIPE